MKNPILTSDAPLFIAFSSNPNDAEQKTLTLTKDEMLEAMSNPSSYDGAGFKNGWIVCALNPIDYKYTDEEGISHNGDVTGESMIEMMKLQKQIVDGEKPEIDLSPKPEPEPADDPFPVLDSEPDIAPEIESELDSKPEPLPEHIGLDQVFEMLEAKGYDTPGTQKWDLDNTTYWVLDKNDAMEASVSGPCGSYYPIKPINNPIWLHESDYEPLFLTAQIEAIPAC